MSARDWDAATYDRVSEPQLAWGIEVLTRLDLAGDETVLDVGCGTGRVTALLADRLPRGLVIAVDAAPSMVDAARPALGERATVLCADVLDLELDEPSTPSSRRPPSTGSSTMSGCSRAWLSSCARAVASSPSVAARATCSASSRRPIG